MQTNFSLAQLAKPEINEANNILRNCVHCGFCLATCPTYNLLGNELDSPRGRIYLIKEMLEGNKKVTEDTSQHIDRCLSCMSCMTTCPSSVHYGHLVDTARQYIEKNGSRPLLQRVWRFALANIVPYPKRFRAALFLARLFNFLSAMFKKINSLKPLGAMLRLAKNSVAGKKARTGIFSPKEKAKARPKEKIVLLGGCAQSVLDSEINNSLIELLTRLNIEVIVPKNAGCCGSLVHHMGRHNQSKSQAKQLIDVWSKLSETKKIDAIVSTTSGCGVFIKDYDYIFRNDSEYKQKATKIKNLFMDISEYLAKCKLPNPTIDVKKIKIAYHSACSLRHGQGIVDMPLKLLRGAGFQVQEPKDAHLCCGSAGVYNILQSEIADELGKQKINELQKLNCDAITSGNIGCLKHLQSSEQILRVPILHIAKLLNWVYGGKKPKELK